MSSLDSSVRQLFHHCKSLLVNPRDMSLWLLYGSGLHLGNCLLPWSYDGSCVGFLALLNRLCSTHRVYQRILRIYGYFFPRTRGWKQGCETWTGLYGPTGITGNRSLMQVFNSQEPAYTRKAVNRANRGQTSRVWKPLMVLAVQIWNLFLELTTIVVASNHHAMPLDL